MLTKLTDAVVVAIAAVVLWIVGGVIVAAPIVLGFAVLGFAVVGWQWLF